MQSHRPYVQVPIKITIAFRMVDIYIMNWYPYLIVTHAFLCSFSLQTLSYAIQIIDV
jgi:hypothetical protein